MSLSPLENYFNTLPEPYQTLFLFLRQKMKEWNLEEKWRYKVPFYYEKNRYFCYFNYQPKVERAYIGFIKGHLLDHPKLVDEGKKLVKYFIISPDEDLDIKSLQEIITLQKQLYEK